MSASLTNTLKSYSLAKELKSVIYLKKNTNLRSNIYSDRNNDKEAYLYFTEFKIWSDSMELKQKEALHYAKQLENSKQSSSLSTTNALTIEKATIDDSLFSIFRIALYPAIAIAAGFLFYKFFILFTNR